MSTSKDFRIHRRANVVTKPNPDVVGINYDGPELSSADELLRDVSKFWTMSREVMFANKRRFVAESRQVLFQSFKDIDQRKAALVPYKNGFVNGMIRAFQQDLHFVLRADDMWLAIMVQFSCYIKGHTKERRRFFVVHKGKEEFIVDMRPQSLATIDFEHIASLFADLLRENVIDPNLKA